LLLDLDHLQWFYLSSECSGVLPVHPSPTTLLDSEFVDNIPPGVELVTLFRLKPFATLCCGETADRISLVETTL